MLAGRPGLESDAAANAVRGAPAASVAGHDRLGRGVIRLLQGPAAALAVSEPLCNLPPELSPGEQGERSKIRRPKSDQAARCTSNKCVSTCVLGGYGAPFNVSRYSLPAADLCLRSTHTRRFFNFMEHLIHLLCAAMDGWMDALAEQTSGGVQGHFPQPAVLVRARKS
jgi:hypothetical protein